MRHVNRHDDCASPALQKGLGIAGFVLLLLCGTPALAQETVVKESENAQQIVWRIDQPEVGRPRKDYPSVQFRKYDEVVVTGGGCVHTGGFGKTWKRYIDPSGDNSDRLYHGRISIPGATAGLVRISSIEGLHLVVNKFPLHDDGSPMYLQLGYEDDVDDYKDNDYTHHDNGNNKQCALSKDPDAKDGKAFLKIAITHHDDLATAPATPMPRAPLDLWWQSVDENFLPYNPDWWQHVPNSKDKDKCDRFREGPHDFLKLGKSPNCTMWDPDVDEAKGLDTCQGVSPLANSVHGHVNWANVAYYGTVYFDVSNNGGHPGSVPGDGDYDWWFSPRDASGKAIENGSSTANPVHAQAGKRALAMEFLSRETVDRISNTGSWWERFHAAVDTGLQNARDMVDGKEAIAIGLIGFDNEHGNKPEGARVEIHPVFVLAIHVQEPNDDYWAILARNWGGEGLCSNGFDLNGGKWLHYLSLPDNKIKLFLPAKSTMKIDKKDFHTSEGDPKFSTTEYENGVMLTIELPAPEGKRLFWGELHLKNQ